MGQHTLPRPAGTSERHAGHDHTPARHPAINAHVVNVLEGTMPAFKKRRIK